MITHSVAVSTFHAGQAPKDLWALAFQTLPSFISATVAGLALWVAVKQSGRGHKLAERQTELTTKRLTMDLFDKRYAAFKEFERAAYDARNDIDGGKTGYSVLIPVMQTSALFPYIFKLELALCSQEILYDLRKLRMFRRRQARAATLDSTYFVPSADIDAEFEADDKFDCNMQKLAELAKSQMRIDVIE